ncbi:MAG: hypothetical protein HKN15_02920 [Xanthomonadales bacterium]|nr:hypothetical protein [Xanthomonadales bacterium]
MNPAGGQGSSTDIHLVTRRCLRAQSLTGLALAGALLLVGPVAAYSSLFGSLAAYVPSLLFALIVLRNVGGDSAAFLRAAVLGEAAKLLTTALICMAVFMLVEPLAYGWFFAGMILVIFIGFLRPLFGG